jgi:hypothetical protein
MDDVLEYRKLTWRHDGGAGGIVLVVVVEIGNESGNG